MYLLSMIDSDVLIAAIEKEMTRLGRDLSNAELQDLVHILIKDGKATLLHRQEQWMDLDLLAGNLREEGVKVLNVGEELRKKQRIRKG